MSWVHFYWLWLLLPIVTLVVLGVFLIKKNEARIGAWINPVFWREIMPGFIPHRGTILHLLMGGTILFAILALARPQWGAEEEWLDNTGSDIALVLDVSNSMLAEDSAPSRLARAKLMIRRLTRELGQDRVAIIIFAGTSALVAPFTSDSAYLETVLDILEPQAIQNQGTNIELALETAIDAFQRIGSPEGMHRSIVLITDGEDFGLGAKAYIEKEIKDKFIFFAVGVGTEEGAPVPLRTENGSLLTYKKDSSGKPVVSKLNRKELVALTQSGKGEYLDLTSPDAVAGTLLKSMDRTKRQDALRKVTRKIERFQYPLLLSILFLLAVLLVRRTQTKGSRIVLSILIFFIGSDASFAGTLGALDRYIHEQRAERRIQAKDIEGAKKDLEASLEPESPETAFNLGTVISTEEDPEDRHKKLLEESARESLRIGDYDTAASAEYNLGSKSLERKKHDEAIPHLLDAIEIARRGGNAALEKTARLQLANAVEQKKQQQQQKQQDQQDPKDKKDDQDKQDQEQDQQQQQANNGREPKPKPFKSDSLTREAAEGIMRQLADNEKRLQMKQLQSKTRKQEKDQNGQDW